LEVWKFVTQDVEYFNDFKLYFVNRTL
jgi:hypothetical protein